MLSPLQAALLRLIYQIIGRSPRKRHNRERGILVGVGDEGSAIGYEKILHVVCLAILIENGSFRIVAHSRRTDLVDDHAAISNSVRPHTIGRGFRMKDPASFLYDRAKGFLHILRHLDFVVAPLPVKSKNRNPPLIDRIGIDFAIAILVRNHLATAIETDVGAIRFAASLFQRGTVTFDCVTDIFEISYSGHGAS